jgi:hypothetical protein
LVTRKRFNATKSYEYCSSRKVLVEIFPQNMTFVIARPEIFPNTFVIILLHRPKLNKMHTRRQVVTPQRRNFSEKVSLVCHTASKLPELCKDGGEEFVSVKEPVESVGL